MRRRGRLSFISLLLSLSLSVLCCSAHCKRLVQKRVQRKAMCFLHRKVHRMWSKEKEGWACKLKKNMPPDCGESKKTTKIVKEVREQCSEARSFLLHLLLFFALFSDLCLHLLILLSISRLHTHTHTQHLEPFLLLLVCQSSPLSNVPGCFLALFLARPNYCRVADSVRFCLVLGDASLCFHFRCELVHKK